MESGSSAATPETLTDGPRSEFVYSTAHLRALVAASMRCTDPTLRTVIKFGIGFHHAGLTASDRHLVERLFRDRLLPVLCTTSTLAVGVNLPAYLVIVKGTSAWRGGDKGYEEISRISLTQMMGRAGRPQFDSTGTAIIMTQRSQQQLYEAIATGTEVIESQLHLQLREHIGAEVAIGTIDNLDSATLWLQGTFFAVRARRHPRRLFDLLQSHQHEAKLPSLDVLTPLHSQAPHLDTTDEDDEEVESSLRELAALSLLRLARASCLTVDGVSNPSDVASLLSALADGAIVRRTQVGLIMARSYIRFHTIDLFVSALQESGAHTMTLVRAIADSEELLQEAMLRRSDKRSLNEFNTRGARFRIKGRVKTPSDKMFLILQAIVQRVRLGDPRLNSDLQRAKSLLPRLSRTLSELAVCSDVNSSASVYAMELVKSFELRQWADPGGSSNFRQLSSLREIKFTDAMALRLEAAGLCSIDSVMRSFDHDLRAVIGSSQNQSIVPSLRGLLRSIPRFTISSASIHQSDDPSSLGTFSVQVQIARAAPFPEPDGVLVSPSAEQVCLETPITFQHLLVIAPSAPRGLLANLRIDTSEFSSVEESSSVHRVSVVLPSSRVKEGDVVEVHLLHPRLLPPFDQHATLHCRVGEAACAVPEIRGKDAPLTSKRAPGQVGRRRSRAKPAQQQKQEETVIVPPPAKRQLRIDDIFSNRVRSPPRSIPPPPPPPPQHPSFPNSTTHPSRILLPRPPTEDPPQTLRGRRSLAGALDLLGRKSRAHRSQAFHGSAGPRAATLLNPATSSSQTSQPESSSSSSDATKAQATAELASFLATAGSFKSLF